MKDKDELRKTVLEILGERMDLNDNQARATGRVPRPVFSLLSLIREGRNPGSSEGFLGKFHGDPSSYTEGDLWYDLDAHLYKGYNGTTIVSL